MDNYYVVTIAGILGVAAHTIIKYMSLQKDAKTANLKLSFTTFLTNDWPAIVLSFIAIGIWLVAFGEVAAKYPKIKDFTILSFFAMGALGSYIIQLFLSKSKSWIDEKVDKSTNIADNKTK